MQISRSPHPRNPVDYFVLPDGAVDVFLRRNEITESKTDDEGNENIEYVAEEVYFRTDKSVTQDMVETNFEYYWNRIENHITEPMPEERLDMLENMILLMMEGQ